MKEDKYFLDTNILVYTFDSNDILKRKHSQHLLEHALETQLGVISYQVVQEFLNVSSR
jgi:predicted nucleic acid-binding protein